MTPEGKPLRLSEQGMALLENWSEDASQADRNAVYKTLFKVADGSAAETCVVMNNGDDQVILIRRGLAVKIAYVGEEEFALLYVGLRDDGAGWGAEAA